MRSWSHPHSLFVGLVSGLALGHHLLLVFAVGLAAGALGCGLVLTARLAGRGLAHWFRVRSWERRYGRVPF